MPLMTVKNQWKWAELFFIIIPTLRNVFKSVYCQVFKIIFFSEVFRLQMFAFNI